MTKAAGRSPAWAQSKRLSQGAAGQPASWELYHIFTCSSKAYKLGLLSLKLICAWLANLHEGGRSDISKRAWRFMEKGKTKKVLKFCAESKGSMCFSLLSSSPFPPLSFLCWLLFIHSLILCVDFSMLEAEKIPITWEHAIKVYVGPFVWFVILLWVNHWQLSFFTSSPNIHMEKLKREWFDSTYFALVPESMLTHSNLTA